MITRPKRLPRLWCALQGLLPLEACFAAQRAKLAWPRESDASAHDAPKAEKEQNRVAANGESMNVPRRGPLRNQS
jgi:hypothetical protein